MVNTLYIHAVNIHQGGGEYLLKALLDSIDLECRIILTVDNRLTLPPVLPKILEVRRVKKSVLARLYAEFWLCRHSTEDDYVLCFGNLPPLFPIRAFTTVFIQNRYLIDSAALGYLRPWPRLRIKIERIWLRLAMKHANQFLVQSLSMQKLMCIFVKGAIPVINAPFLDLPNKLIRKFIFKVSKQSPSFVYVASGEGHKNHRRLIEAWAILSKEDIRPHLTLTIDERSFPELCAWMKDQIQNFKLNIINTGIVSQSALVKIYAQSDALIYPSLLESFGLPLIEASCAGLDILAAELDYVRDIVQPVETFDPNSALSIARAVRRYCKYNNPELQFLSPAEFLNICLNKNQ